MDKQFKIPAFVWVIAAILVVCILFLIFVQVPFNKESPKYEKNHVSATSQIAVYEDYLSRADSVQKSIDTMRQKYDEESKKLFINAQTTSEDIRKMLKKLDYDLSTLSVTPGVEDTEGRVSSTGDPLYSTQINFTFTATYQKMVDTLDYFETQSNGAYFISNMNIKLADDDENPETSKASVAPTSAEYTVQLTMNLYYFNPDLSSPVSSSAVESSAA